MGLGTNIGQRKRYPGLTPFTQEQQDIFYGRDEDVERLFNTVLIEKLIVLFGKSGYGKTSLLNAGLIPKLNDENVYSKRKIIPIIVRFNVYDQKLADSLLLNEQQEFLWFDKFLNNIQNVNFYIGNKKGELLKAFEERWFLPKTIWGELKRHQPDSNCTFILIFDQFEEFFTYPIEEQREFKNQLADILYSDIPGFLDQYSDQIPADYNDVDFLYNNINVKIIFSLRSDRISLLDSLKDFVPTILHKRYELKGLSEKQAREAISGPASAVGKFTVGKFTYSPDAVKIIIKELTAVKSRHEVVSIESFHLQMICQAIENIVEKRRIKEIMSQDLPDMASVYQNYYSNQINKLPELLQPIAKKIIEEELVDDKEARRISVDGRSLLRKENVTQALLNSLEDLFLIRREPNSVGSFSYEFSHDVLIDTILKSKEERKLREDQQKKEQELKDAKDRAEEQERRLQKLLEIRSKELKLALDIAQQQKQEAEVEREKARQQAEIANQAKLEAERQRQKAEEEKRNAENQVIIANEAKRESESQRQKAEKQTNAATIARANAEIAEQKSKRNAKIAWVIAATAVILGIVAIWYFLVARKQQAAAKAAQNLATANLLKFQETEINTYLQDAEVFQKSGDTNYVITALDSAQHIVKRYFSNDPRYNTLIKRINEQRSKNTSHP